MDVYDTKGKVIEKVTLPQKIFGAKINRQLLAQAVRVYLTNQRQGTSATKSRGEVQGSTRKIYRQKGTGRARHGGIRAPIFVHGGIAHGPKPKSYSLSLPKKMKRAALMSALSDKRTNGAITIVSQLDSVEPKTKAMFSVLKNLGLADKKAKKTLVILPEDNPTLVRSMRNIAGISITVCKRLNTYEVLKHTSLLLPKEAVSVIEEVFGR